MDDPEPVGYVVALPPEGRTLISRRSCRGDILTLKPNHWVAISGAGIDNAGAAAEALVKRGARRLVSWGCAAALTNDLAPGDLVIPDKLVYADGTRASLASAWYERLLTQLKPQFPVRIEGLAESRAIVASADEKRRVHHATGAVATDMETGAVARAALRHDLPCIAVRSIVDTASVAIPSSAEAALDGHGEIVVLRLLAQIAKNPAEIVPLLRLFRAFRSAMRTLERVAMHAGPSLDPR